MLKLGRYWPKKTVSSHLNVGGEIRDCAYQRDTGYIDFTTDCLKKNNITLKKQTALMLKITCHAFHVAWIQPGRGQGDP